MEGFQYCHMEVYSVKGAPGASSEGIGKRKNGERAWTTADVIAEVTRDPLASLHVVADRPGPQIIPVASKDFAEFRAAHEKAANIKVAFGYTKKDGTNQTRRRKLRADAATLYSSVYSLPVLSEDALKDPKLRAECEAVLQNALEFETSRIEPLGGTVELGVIHWDEDHVHLHILALDRTRGRVDHLHPGRVAKADVHKRLEKDPDRASVNRAANREYCEAMRGWQDDFFKAVSRKAGLLRFGPKRFRLSRADYHSAKKLAALVVENEKLDEERKVKDVASEQKAKRAEVLFKEADRTKATAQAQVEAIEAGVDALNSGEAAYRPAREDRPENIIFGPNAPVAETERKKLSQRLEPAAKFLIGYGRKLFALRQAEGKLEVSRRALAEEKSKHGAAIAAEKAKLASEKAKHDEQMSAAHEDLKNQKSMHDQAMAAAQAKLAAESARHAEELEAERAALKSEKLKQVSLARFIKKAFDQMRKTAPAPILALLFPEQDHVYDPADFPDAWAVPKDADAKWVQEHVEAMPNMTLWKISKENIHAERLSYGDPELQAGYAQATKLIASEATERGFNLLDGRHNPKNAKNPEKAKRHTDGNPDPIRVVKKAEKQRVLVRK